MTKYALLVGLTEVNAKAYNGWNGKSGCEGCENDVKNFHHILSDYKLNPSHTTTLLTAKATREQLLNNLKNAAAICKSGDMFVFYYTGHGGQVRNLASDEPDGKDETLVCYDGEVVDDELNKIWVNFRKGVRIVMITDCCNSETNFRNRITHPRANESSKLDHLAEKLVDESDMKAMMIHIGACADGDTAAGFKKGGLFTQTIKKILDKNAFKGTYKMLVDEILERTADFDQKANYHEYGPVDSNEFYLFRSSNLFEDKLHASLTATGAATLFARGAYPQREATQAPHVHANLS